MFCFLLVRLPPISTRPAHRLPYPTLVRSPVPVGEDRLCCDELVIGAAVDRHGQYLPSGVPQTDEPGELRLVLGDSGEVDDRGAAPHLRDVTALADDEAAVLGVGEVELPVGPTLINRWPRR